MTDGEAGAHLDVLVAAARELQARHRIEPPPARPIPAWVAVDAVESWLRRARVHSADPEPEAAKAAEWLLDNDYQVERAVRQIREDLPIEFYARLPKVVNPGDDGIPRVFSLARTLLEASRLQLSLSGAAEFVRAYQEGAALTIAELWAFPTMLRLACLEILVGAFGRLAPPIKAPFEITRGAAISALPEDTECVARSLANLGVIATISWNDFFESVSRVDATLREDPAQVYGRMDFATRDRYRKVVEEVALAAELSESETAERVLMQAREAIADLAESHVGYWLFDDGRVRTESMLGCRPSILVIGRRWFSRHAGTLYAAGLAAAGVVALVLPTAYLIMEGAGPLTTALGVALALLPASVLSITCVHWLVTLTVAPRLLPKLDFDKGIPPDCATAVVVPAILRNRAEALQLVERLEMHRLANPDSSLRFALLSDHADAPTEHAPDDEEIRVALREGIRQLNTRYGNDGNGPFHLLHRPRLYNASEGCWMGWERKRGKLEEFNRLILGEEVSAFATQEGDTGALRGRRFVVTVDADTMLPPGTVSRLVGMLAHPLNQAAFDPATGRVRSGYTVVQPRVEISPESGNRSAFARLYTGDTSIDVYSRAVSDVYQDLFGSGVYVGKGVYEVATFHRSVEGRVPENSIVSHDLFEGAHGRTALASDIVLFEGFPASYVAHVRRWNRWVRGDWQLLRWLGRTVPGADGKRLRNSLSFLDRWKIFDNLRRSLIPPALVALVLAGWLVLPGSPWVWTVLAAVAPGANLVTDLVTGLARGRRRGAMRSVFRRLQDHAGRWVLAIAFLMNDAIVAADAVVRSLWRMNVSGRHLLQWTSAAHEAARFTVAGAAINAWREMWMTPILSIAFALVVALANPHALWAAAPLLLLWFASPGVAVWTGRADRKISEELTDDDRAFLRLIARRTWLYFETFVGPEDNWLPPDNVHDQPHLEVAHRTSPTNVGMLFLSSLTAWDLGYVSTADLSARSRNALAALDRLERYRGHFLNWYDTRRLSPLEPRYVSTVDSGNLAVSLVALKEGCLDAASSSVLRAVQWDGLADTLRLLADALENAGDATVSGLSSRVEAIIARATHVQEEPSSWHATLIEFGEGEFMELEIAVGAAIAESESLSTNALREIRIWLERTHHHLGSMRRELDDASPWLALLHNPPGECRKLAQSVETQLALPLSLIESEDACARARQILAAAAIADGDDDVTQWQTELDAAIARGAATRSALRQALVQAAATAERMAFAMDFQWVFDRETRLFRIGYNVSSDRVDPNHYDLLASEARLASYFAIAKGDVPLEHWFFLGRPITRLAGELVLLSWNGSMFEYLMPPLLMRSGAGTLVGQSERAAVDAQRAYGKSLGIPWGTSESAFGSIDPEHRYRYRAFGVPGLGIRRGLARDRVIAPYASALALAVRPRLAVENLRTLDNLGLSGSYGFVDAADYTPDRMPAGKQFMPVRTYMAHHQGMALAAIGNALSDDRLVALFRRDKRMRTAGLLLHERIPWELPPEPVPEERAEHRGQASAIPAPHPWAPPSAESSPQMHLLGNGSLATWISEAGGGRLLWKRQALTRWLPDTTLDRHGLWIYVRDEEDGAIWSAGREPTGAVADDARVVFHPHMAEFHRRDRGIALRMEVGVVPGDDLEIRSMTLVNESDRSRAIALTSYGEVVLSPALEDERHPAFSKLFVSSEYIPALDGLLFTRRPRHPHDRSPVLFHRLLWDERGPASMGYDADRRCFVGRGGSLRSPRGVAEGLSGTTGWTLDPIMALQARLEMKPQESRRIAFLTMASGSRESVLEMAERYATMSSLDWALRDAATDVAREGRRLGLQPSLFPTAQALASRLLSAYPGVRIKPSDTNADRHGQPQLWGLGISGDLPILVLRTQNLDEPTLLRDLVRVHGLWRRRDFDVDIVVTRTGESGYEEPLREHVLSLLQEVGGHEQLGRRGGIHLLFADQIGTDGSRLLEHMARIVLDDSRASLSQQLSDSTEGHMRPPRFEPSVSGPTDNESGAVPRPTDLVFDNGFGGFSADGHEYVIHLRGGQRTPAPWSNILANEELGTIVTEAGPGFTWSINSGENRLTPWPNDPVTDTAGEALYLRDEESGEVWTPTPAPAGLLTGCEIRHGAGYSRWRQRYRGLETDLTIFVPPDAPVKIARLRVRNLSGKARRTTATYYAEWLLGALASVSRPHVRSWYDAESHALLARNPWNPDFAERTAFLTSTLPPHSLTTDRQDFLGRNGDPALPEGLTRWDLGGRVEPKADPCAAFQVHLDIGDGETSEVAFVLGQGRDNAHALELARQWRVPQQVEDAWARLGGHWNCRLGTIQVRTPDPAFNLMINRWLLYQTLSSRILARAGFYQAGGAIGFRDQLQDVLALLHSDPDRAREHILACAARQFEEGDVLHWWHPPSDRGVRTRCSDDLLWLPFVACRYVEATGDLSILSEEVPFLRGAPLTPQEEDHYGRFEVSAERRLLFEHCERALERGVTSGPHGLPLIGSGDWNDGMNRLGRQGRGESVWLAWFAIATMTDFAALADRCDRQDLAERWRKRGEGLRRTVDEVAWDGDWYLRAFDDEGWPLGSASNDECRIDSISQSWAVMSATDLSPRADVAVNAAVRELVSHKDRIVRLLWPPFHDTPRDLGYIRAYPPGIRENGGQYTHAAAWLGIALARLGDGDRAYQIFDTISPIRHAASPEDAARYRTEPYVIAADVAGVAPHTGRGGWTWYTGSAAWTWRLGTEAILGIRLHNGELVLDPCLPKDWGGYEAEIRRADGTVLIRVQDRDHLGRGDLEIVVDGTKFTGPGIPFPTDGSVRIVLVRLKPPSAGGPAPPNARA